MDFLIVNWNKLDSLPEIIMLIGGMAAIGLAVYYIFTRDKNKIVGENNKATIESYKERLEVVEAETKSCHEQHAQNLEKINTMQGELKAYKELVLIPKDFIKELQRNQKEIIKLLKGNNGKSK